MTEQMQDTEAREIIANLRDTAVTDTINLQRRIKELKLDYKFDPWEETAVQIQRLEMRLDRKVQEAKALAIAATKFEGVAPGRDIGPGTEVRVVKTAHLDLLEKSGTVQLVTSSGNYEVRIGSTVIVLGPDQVEKVNPHYYPPIKTGGKA